jgi:hypothetical protein
VGGEFPITAISGDSGPPIFPLEIDEHDQLGAKDTKRERSRSVLPQSTVGNLCSIHSHKSTYFPFSSQTELMT